MNGTVQAQYMELNRMWLDDKAPRNSENQAISYAIKYIKKACPTVTWIHSFAVERCRGLGVVCQASNFVYCGYHYTNFYELDGETYHDMMRTRKDCKRAIYLQSNIARAHKHCLRQFRYIFFIKNDWQKRPKFKIQPYPKRNH